MKFPFWVLGQKRKDDVAVMATPGFVVPVATDIKPAVRPVHTPVITPMPVNPVIQDMEQLLARTVYRVGESIAKTELYFPASDLDRLGISCNSKELIALADHKSRELLLRSDIRRGERYAFYTGELAAALATAERAAILFRLISGDSANATALSVMRRVADACDKVIFHSAKLLEAEPADSFKWGNSVIVAQGEAQTALNKAMILLNRRPALLSPATEKMARAAIWATIIAADACAHAALECREAILPNSPSYGVVHA
jgi:hypothetical protein